MNIPAPHSRRHARQRDSDNPGDAEESESLVSCHPLVVVTKTESRTQRHVHDHARHRKSWRGAELEIRAFLSAAVSLAVQLLSHDRVRPARPPSKRADVIERKLERHLAHGVETPVRTRVRGVRHAEARALAETEAERRVEVGFVPELPAGTITSRNTRVETVPEADVDADAPEHAVTGMQRDSQISVRPHHDAGVILRD